MAEQSPSFDCGFEILNDIVNTSVEEESDEAVTAEKKRFVEVTKTKKNSDTDGYRALRLYLSKMNPKCEVLFQLPLRDWTEAYCAVQTV